MSKTTFSFSCFFSCPGLKARARKEARKCAGNEVIKVAVLLLLFCTGSLAFSQLKYEREYRISKEEVPEEALAYIQKIGFDKKVKWYREEGLKSWSIEAKTRDNGQLYSIEFDSLGRIEDVEIKIKWKEVHEEGKKAIEEVLRKDFSK
jgi:hypothetical protein